MIPILDDKKRLVGVVTSTEVMHQIHQRTMRQGTRGGDIPVPFELPMRNDEGAFRLKYYNVPLYRNGQPLHMQYGYSIYEGDIEALFAHCPYVQDLRYAGGINLKDRKK